MASLSVASIRIGGEVLQSQLIDLINLGISPEMEGPIISTVAEAMEIVKKENHLVHRSNMVTWGEFHDIESYLIYNHIQFDRKSEGNSLDYYPPTITYYRPPNDIKTISSSLEFDPILSYDKCIHVLELLKHEAESEFNRVKIAIEYMEDALGENVIPLSPFVLIP